MGLRIDPSHGQYGFDQYQQSAPAAIGKRWQSVN